MHESLLLRRTILPTGMISHKKSYYYLSSQRRVQSLSSSQRRVQFLQVQWHSVKRKYDKKLRFRKRFNRRKKIPQTFGNLIFFGKRGKDFLREKRKQKTFCVFPLMLFTWAFSPTCLVRLLCLLLNKVKNEKHRVKNDLIVNIIWNSHQMSSWRIPMYNFTRCISWQVFLFVFFYLTNTFYKTL